MPKIRKLPIKTKGVKSTKTGILLNKNGNPIGSITKRYTNSWIIPRLKR